MKSSDVTSDLFIARNPREHLAETHKGGGNLAARHNDAYCRDDHHETEDDARSELLAEDGYAKEYGSYRFKGTEDGCWCAAYVLDGSRGAAKGDCGRKDSKGYQT